MIEMSGESLGRSRRVRGWAPISALFAVVAGACSPAPSSTTSPAPEQEQTGVEQSAQAVWDNQFKPVPGVHLSVYSAPPRCGGSSCVDSTTGLVTSAGLDEATPYYNAINHGSLNTLDQWKAYFGIRPRGVLEPLTDYRKAINAVIYYNVTELGLGREIACGTNGHGIGCFVTNYGDNFNDKAVAQLDAKYGPPSRAVKNTVVISYQPSLPPGSQVNFAAYGSNGERLNYAQLDYMGKRPIPAVCTRCHGGSYDGTTHLTKNGRFLPLNPDLIEFAPDGEIYDRQSQEEAIKYINNMSYGNTALLTSRQTQYLERLYQATPTPVGTYLQFWNQQDPRAAVNSSEPPGWKAAGKGELYRNVALRYCDTCHMAFGGGRAYETLDSWSLFGNPVNIPIVTEQIGYDYNAAAWLPRDKFRMPQAQPALNRFWGEGVVIDGVGYQSAGHATLAAFGRLGVPLFSASLGCQHNSDCGQSTTFSVSGGLNGGRVCDNPGGTFRRCIDGCQPTADEFSQCPGTDTPVGTPGYKEWCVSVNPTTHQGTCSRCGGLGEVPCNSFASDPPPTGPNCDEHVNPGCRQANVDCRFGTNYGSVCAYTDYSAGHPAGQSSDAAFWGQTYTADRATDSDTSGDWWAPGATLTHTWFDQNAYWYVNLQGNHRIKYVNITNRTDCCWDRLSDYKVWGFTIDHNQGGWDALMRDIGYWSVISDASGYVPADGSQHRHAVDANVAGVMIKLNGSNYLHLGNVTVLGL
jgi:hypothetical protein